MTRDISSAAVGPRGAVTPSGARRSHRTRGLAHEIVEALTRRIRTQEFRPGDKLPSEAEIMQTFGVSRSVVREAVSMLQAARLAVTHQGVGTFALEPLNEGLLQVEPLAMHGLEHVLTVLELRLSLESESAALAAVRRTPAQLADMHVALNEFERHLPTPGETVSPDFRFHLAIALATGNHYFADLMGQLGPAVISRTRVSATWLDPEQRLRRLQKVHREHEQIYEAIARQDAESARAAMRIHLTNSRERQKDMQHSGGDPGLAVG